MTIPLLLQSTIRNREPLLLYSISALCCSGVTRRAFTTHGGKHVEELNHTNCRTYLLSSGGLAALVDPVRERVDRYRQVIADRGLKLDLIIETHMHADHLMINREFKEALGAPVFMHRESPSPLVDRHAARQR